MGSLHEPVPRRYRPQFVVDCDWIRVPRVGNFENESGVADAGTVSAPAGRVNSAAFRLVAWSRREPRGGLIGAGLGDVAVIFDDAGVVTWSHDGAVERPCAGLY